MPNANTVIYVSRETDVEPISKSDISGLILFVIGFCLIGGLLIYSFEFLIWLFAWLIYIKTMPLWPFTNLSKNSVRNTSQLFSIDTIYLKQIMQIIGHWLNVAPIMGLEPMTLGLTVPRSTN